MAKKSNNKVFVSQIGPFEEDASSRGKAKKRSGGRHTAANIAKLAGPPEAMQSIATGTLKTKSRMAEEAAEIEAMEAAAEAAAAGWETDANAGDYWSGYDAGYDEGYGYDAGYDGAFDPGYGGAYDAGYDQPYDGAYDAGYDPGYDAGYDPGYDGTYDAGYDPVYDVSPNPAFTGGYDPAYDAAYDSGFDAGYNPAYADGWDGYSDGYDGWDGAWATQPDGEGWLDDAVGGKRKRRGLFGRRKQETELPPYPTMTLEEKYDAEAAARARANAAVEAYESGVPLGLALGNLEAGFGFSAADLDAEYADGQGLDSGISFQPGEGMGSAGAKGAAAKFAAAVGGGVRAAASGVPSMRGMGVQVQIPTASMEKSLNLSTAIGHQRRVEAGTGSKVRAMRASGPAAVSGIRGAERTSYGMGKELGKMFRRRLFTIFIILVVVLFAAVVGAGVGYYVSLSNRLGLEDLDAVEAVLTEPEDNAPYYVLFAADLNSMDGSKDDLDAMLLARIDETNRKVTLLAIPGNIEVILSDYDYHPATDARADGGNARLILAVSNLLGVDIAHFVTTDASGLATIIDALGGVDMDITAEIDDPQAGWQFFKPGQYTLSGEEALTVLRADNFHEGESMRSRNRYTFGEQLLLKILNSGFMTSANVTDIIAGNVSTDYTAREIISLARVLRGLTSDDVMKGEAPGTQTTEVDGTRIFSPSYTGLKQVVALMDAGVNPVLEDRQGTNVNPSDVTVTVWNGSGVSGGAAMLGEILSDAGFDVQEITNAKAYVYTETLIIYDDDSNIEAAYAVQNALGQGRVLDGTWKYAFTTDILVVLGSEWK